MYKIICDSSINCIASQVTEEMQHGFIPTGGIYAEVTTMGYTYYYYQSMYKPIVENPRGE